MNDLFNHMDKREQMRGKNKGVRNGKREVVEEPLITSEELVPLGDLKTTLPGRKSLLNARIIFVIGKQK